MVSQCFIDLTEKKYIYMYIKFKFEYNLVKPPTKFIHRNEHY